MQSRSLAGFSRAWRPRIPSSTSPEQGYDLGEIQSPRALAFGGAQVALGTSTTALFLNPANLPLARVYHFEALAAVSPEAQRQSYGGAVVDSSTSSLAGGLTGTWNLQIRTASTASGPTLASASDTRSATGSPSEPPRATSA